jgi:hypothetical protein
VGAGCCSTDNDCDGGSNGRCERLGTLNIGACTYDQCVTNGDCMTGTTCLCAANDVETNRCLPSSCRLDSDCGAGCGCSPTWDMTCGARDGYVGVYCHAEGDDCVNDSDCHTDAGIAGYCAFSKDANKWVCAFAFCAG